MNESFSFLPPVECDKPYSISEINLGIATIIESGNTLLWLEGEISNFKKAASGHCYLKLKDEQSQIPAVIWRSNAARLEFEPAEGDAVMAIASLRVYQKGGYYQLDIHRMQPAGIGALFAAYEKLKKKLTDEGLFDAKHKKSIPKTVVTLGVITAKHGAALRDIIKVVAKRAPQTTLVIHDVLVQGDKAAGQIANALRAMNEYAKVDCIIVGRGGGSIEDLWAFNDEKLARAIFDSHIPVISAVGHEIDFTIADFVADVRAPTPSAAAELAVSDRQENSRYYQALAQRFGSVFERYYISVRRRYRQAAARSSIRKPLRMLSEARQQCDEYHDRCIRALAHMYRKRRDGMRHAAAQLQALSPIAILARGYSVVQKENGEAVRRSSQLSRDEQISISFHEGKARANVADIEP
jgi:exodeoxyribonuclease VII large subunit